MRARSAAAAASMVLTALAISIALAGAGAAAAAGLWSHLLLVVSLAAAALFRHRDPHWSAVLALVAAAYCRSPIREALGIELPPFEAVIALPLWWELLAERGLAGHARALAIAGASIAVVAGLSAALLPRGAHWVATAPLAGVAIAWLALRDWRLGRRAAPGLCCAALAVPVLHLLLELSWSHYPARTVAPVVNVWLATIAFAVVVWSVRRSQWTVKA